MLYEVITRIEGAAGDLVAGGDQLAQDRTFAHDLGIAPDVRRRRRIDGQLTEVGQPTCFAALTCYIQTFSDGHRISRLRSLKQLNQPRLIFLRHLPVAFRCLAIT